MASFKKILAAGLAAVMCIGSMSIGAMAAETDWQGDVVSVSMEEGEEAYVYAIGQDSVNKRYYYETSNHTVKKEVTGGGAIHIFPIVDTTKVTGQWTPDGIYVSGVSNYDVMYCCDAVTSTADGIYYKRVNLEDSEYVTEADAKRLRAIVANAYPYVSVEEAKAALKEAGFAQADELDRSELITATQAAIWTIANPDSGDSYRYNKTATTGQKLTWGGYMHEFAAENTNFKDSTTSRKYLSNPNGAGTRVNALIDFYLAMEGVDAANGQIVISRLNFEDNNYLISAKGNDKINFVLNVELSHSGDADDDLVINVYAGNEIVETVDVVPGKTIYSISAAAPVGTDVKAVVSGTQNLQRGVYFYQPKPEDVDGNGVATSREVSQNLIGVAVGETPVYAEATIDFNKVTFKSGQVSNISYMFINKETGAVEFLRKIDVAEGTTSAPVIIADGYVSVMFMKQSTSGMFWFSEEVSKELENQAIKCLIANNPSYKTHDAVEFGEGAHDLTYKKKKTVTYVFMANDLVKVN